MIEVNKIYLSDNLDFMKKIENNFIDLIYSDILYNTRRNNKDFNDNLGNTQKALEWYEPRLKEMHRILKSTGTIYLQMDYRLIHYIKVLMDKIFGESNFRNEIIWHYNSSPRKKNCFSSRHDTILRYSKTDIFYFDDTQVREPYSKTAPRGYDKEKYYNPLGKVMGDVWDIKMLAQNDKTERVGYSTQKPKRLLEPIIKSSSQVGDIVADFFAGSGTTGVVAQELNRNFILCDNNPNAVEISKKRLGL